MQTFHYTNTYGFHKMLDINETPDANGKYHCILWCTDNGELCGSGDLTVEEIKDYFRENNISGVFNPK